MLPSFENYLIANGKSAKSAKNYAGAIEGPISQWAISSNLIQKSLVEIDSLFDTQTVSISPALLTRYCPVDCAASCENIAGYFHRQRSISLHSQELKTTI